MFVNARIVWKKRYILGKEKLVKMTTVKMMARILFHNKELFLDICCIYFAANNLILIISRASVSLNNCTKSCWILQMFNDYWQTSKWFPWAVLKRFQYLFISRFILCYNFINIVFSYISMTLFLFLYNYTIILHVYAAFNISMHNKHIYIYIQTHKQLGLKLR